MTFTQDKFEDFNYDRSIEWLETNGIGGYASGTASGANTRRYHGLLVAATQPPVGRMVLVSKLDEIITESGEVYELGTNQYPGAIHPEGFHYLKKFERNLFPEFHFEAGNIELKKTIVAVQGENTTLVLYEVINAKEKFKLELLPLYAARDYHYMSHANDSIGRQYLFDNGLFQTLNYQGSPEIFIHVPRSKFQESQAWYYNFEYAIEQERGMDFREDLFTHGKFVIELRKGSKLGIILSTEDPAGKDPFKLFQQEKRRREKVVKNFSWNKDLKRLALAADQFIVKRGDLKTIIAGYPWFSDWGRDTMIALPGLCLTTERYDDAKTILQTFANSVSDGMLPNRFPDTGEAPEYNTIDATLWFFQAIYHYYERTHDKEFIRSLLPVLEEIVNWHYNGTRHNIHVDPEDSLLTGGEQGIQLTWMDAKVSDWVVTPRRGKAIEINALWHNALSILAHLMVENGKVAESEAYRTKAEKVAESFNEMFWNEKSECLYDYIDGDYKDQSIRPNQIYAISLPFPLLSKTKAAKVLKIVEQRLLTSRGLRSLSNTDQQYRPFYIGDLWQRDGAYHQGTVWSFLLGAYIDALIAVKGDKGKTEAGILLNGFMKHLDEAGVGSVSEIFDGDPPHAPRGCIAQAWGVAEVLRVAVEYGLVENPKKRTAGQRRMELV